MGTRRLSDPDGAPNGFAVPINALPDAVAFLSPVSDEHGQVADFRFEQSNQGFQSLLEVAEADLFAQSLSTLGVGHWFDLLAAAVRDQHRVSAWVSRSPGAEAPVLWELHASPLWFGVLVVLRPVSAAEPARLGADESWFQQLLEDSTDLITGVVAGRIEWMSSSVTRELGWTLAELRAVDVRSLFHPDDRRLFRELGSVMSSGEVVRLRHRLIDRGGRYHWLETSVSPLSGSGRLVRGFLASSRLVDELAAQEAERDGLLKEYRRFLDELPVGVYRMRIAPDRASQIEYLNAPAAKQFGFPATLRAVEGARVKSVIHPDDLQAFREALEIAIDCGQDLSVEMRLLLPDKTRWVHSHASLRPDGDDWLLEGITLDITLQKEFERELLVAEAEAQAATAAKSSFLAHMSHEIRTPLTASLGLLQLLRDTQLTAEQFDYVVKSERATRSLLDVINDILDFSKIEAGRFELRPAPFELEQLLRDVAAVLSASLGAKPVDLLYELDPRLPELFVGDGPRLRQILLNLVSNALKFTEVGEVRLKVALAAEKVRAAIIEFEICDTGIGMSEETMARVLEEFTQAENSISRRYQGTGLGLSLSDRLLRLMGSRLELSSVEGQGTTARFQLELELAAAPQPRRRPPGRRLLAVNPYPATASSLRQQCEAWDWDLVLTTEVNEACEVLKEAGGASRFAAILVETHQITSQLTRDLLRLSAAAERALPILLIASNSHQLSRDLEEVAALLVTDSLVRPFTDRQLVELVERACAREGSEEGRAARPIRSLDGLRLLLAEDNELNSEVATNLLTRLGARVTAVSDGESAVQAVLRDPSAFDVVLMDMQMPGTDGIAATKRIRADERCADLPILALTASALSSDLRRCIEAGMNDFVSKPFDRDALAAVIAKWGAMARPEESNGQERSRNGAEKPVLDVAETLARLGNDKAFYRQMVDRFDSKLPAFESTLTAAVSALDFPAGKRIAHSLRGAAATIGAARLAKAAGELESLLGDNPDLELVERAAGLLEEVLHQTQDALATVREAVGGGVTPLR